MKICVVAYKFGTEKELGEHLGTYHYFIEKMRKLVKQGHQVYVVCPWLSLTKRGSKEVDGVKIIRFWPLMVNKIWLWPINKIIRRLYIKQTQKVTLKVVKQNSVDLVYVWQARESGYAIAQIKEQLGVPFYFRQITAWQWHFKRGPEEIFANRRWHKVLRNFGVNIILKFLLDKKSQQIFAKSIYDNADKIVFLSKAAIEESKAFRLDQTKAVDLGVAIEEDLFKPLNRKSELRQELGIKGEKVVLFIGRINFAEKGIGVLLDAMQKIITEVPNSNLVIIGGGGESEWMNKLIGDLNLQNNVQAVGKKPFKDLVKYINASDVFVVPSIWMEAFGQVTIEAMSCGVPVVTSDAGASPEININGQTGFVVPVRDSVTLANSVINILKDEALAKKLGDNARKRVLENYTYDAIINKFLEIIKN
ncbi:MAG: hypothetical protein CMI53_03425 [Parcubacteria group bacterium]|nr:hypothetical protein [Parcubacteria group bacterium]|tara:strand:+ start:2272 stop:3531 length:1260 start_codon:yes stop_codon:yes gene_type:complete